MGDVDIKSNNQSGGITAQNVNTSNGNQFNVSNTSPKENRFKKLIWWVFGIGGFIAAIVTIIKFFSS